ncbi:MAG: kelch repeat-containing protein, partial [Acidobacteria bacterium]|nr:kelch repeat-containing protein [Acidobacteriota bacterium]
LPSEKQAEWSRQLPPVHECSSYQGITTGSYRPELKLREGVLRPDLNVVFDQVAYDTKRARMVYFTGGRTFAYDLRTRTWSDAAPGFPAPPPVSAGTLAYDPVNDEIILAGGGHVAEKGTSGQLAGYTGTWLFDCAQASWRPLQAATQPPPRMNTRLVYDSKNRLMILFAGDAQSHYLADTWLYNVRTRQWKKSAAPGGPPPPS